MSEQREREKGFRGEERTQRRESMEERVSGNQAESQTNEDGEGLGWDAWMLFWTRS